MRPADVRAALPRRGPFRHRGVVVESLADADGGIASLPEHDFDVVRRRAGLPEPVRQRVVRRPDGRYYLDAAWHRPRLVVEVHGVQHLEQLAWDADLERLGEITAGGDRILQISSFAVRHQPERVQALLARCYGSTDV